MAVAKIFSNLDVIDGLATVGFGDKIPSSYDNTQRTMHYPQASGNAAVDNLYGRFKSAPWNESVLPVTAADCDIPTSGGVDAVVTLSAVPYQRHVLHKVDWSYNSTPVGGSGQLTIESPVGTVIHSEYVTNGGTGFSEWDKGLKGKKGDQLQVKLLSGGSTVKGTVNITGRRTE